MVAPHSCLRARIRSATMPLPFMVAEDVRPTQRMFPYSSIASPPPPTLNYLAVRLLRTLMSEHVITPDDEMDAW